MMQDLRQEMACTMNQDYITAASHLMIYMINRNAEICPQSQENQFAANF